MCNIFHIQGWTLTVTLTLTNLMYSLTTYIHPCMHNTVLTVKDPNNIRSNPSPAPQWNGHFILYLICYQSSDM